MIRGPEANLNTMTLSLACFRQCVVVVVRGVVFLFCRAGHLNPGRYKQNKLRETLTRMAKNNKKTLPEGVSCHQMHLKKLFEHVLVIFMSEKQSLVLVIHKLFTSVIWSLEFAGIFSSLTTALP